MSYVGKANKTVFVKVTKNGNQSKDTINASMKKALEEATKMVVINEAKKRLGEKGQVPTEPTWADNLALEVIAVCDEMAGVEEE